MKRVLAILLILLYNTVSLFAGTPIPTPTPLSKIIATYGNTITYLDYYIRANNLTWVVQIRQVTITPTPTATPTYTETDVPTATPTVTMTQTPTHTPRP